MIRYETTKDDLELYGVRDSAGVLLEELGSFVMSDAEAAEAAAERAARTAQMLAMADYDAYVEAQANAAGVDGEDDDDPFDGGPAAAIPVCPACDGDGIGVVANRAYPKCWYCDGLGLDVLVARAAASAAEAKLIARQRRLAAKAEAEGVLVYAEGSRWYATSRSQPGARHCVTAWSCTCQGFIYTGECGHHSLLLARLGWLAEPVTPARECAASSHAVANAA